ncbi:MAG TPA: ATP-dependent Clp protease proteolytic subunit [Opitutales bacterium]|nr:ATP-dependent Clp protease proteolytic subunit [Opitutales bacterium]
MCAFSPNDYRPNRLRAVRICSEIQETAARRIVARHRQLMVQSGRPVTIYVKSKGGFIDSLNKIEDLLHTKDAEGKKRKYVTVASGTTSSAAAYLVVLGHYAYAQPRTWLVFHGVRYRVIEPLKNISSENAVSMVISLEAQNRHIAGKLANMMLYRLINRFKCFWQSPEGGAATQGINADKAIARFIHHVALRLPAALASGFVTDAAKYATHIGQWLQNSSATAAPTAGAGIFGARAGILEAMFRTKIKSLSHLGATAANAAAVKWMADLPYLHHLKSAKYASMIEELTEIYGPALLTDREAQKYQSWQKKSPRQAKVFLIQVAGGRIFKLWCFAAAAGRKLLIGETVFSATEAYWLGLVDEVLGTDLRWEPMGLEQRKRY